MPEHLPFGRRTMQRPRSSPQEHAIDAATRHDEVEFDRSKAALVTGRVRATMGMAVLTNERVLFLPQTFEATMAGGYWRRSAPTLEEMSTGPEPTLVVTLSSITRFARTTCLLSRNRIVLGTSAEAHTFSSCWSRWSPLVRELLVRRHGRQISSVAQRNG